MRYLHSLLLGMILLVGVVYMLNSTANAQFTSPNYKIEESFIGPGGFVDSTSALYSARASLGDTGVGYSASPNYQSFGGYTTTRDEYLEMVVNSATVDMGVLDPNNTATGNASFYVRSYIASGYTVTTYGGPPTSENGDVIDPMVTPGAPETGKEQFGINLVANTIPTTFGSDPVQIPDNTFSFGYAATGYDTPNIFKYNIGDVIARSDSSSGRTDFTISYIMNIAPLTPAGLYQMQHDLVATATF